ncbi:ABC transporter ATP-binding protein [Klenkia taihuensis]|uniref:ATP-binding cassette, subfamily C n=1 Tax=Klenkia taihuensis TaxID=1225127 RepID=A0A1I1GMW4_9ACTN|nr:ABC transporter ATP-binding protein [Klenkia taihuensis]GHE09761.1 multidrug ABC transporter permease [Klenkia taihuensis]SFC10643.1 ATP-binding cassette, subfamily C [Klenkia taihuensis]
MTAPLLPVATPRRAGRVVWAELRARPLATAAAALSAVAAAAAGLVAPAVLGRLVDAVDTGAPSVWPYVGALLAAAVLAAVLTGVSAVLVARLGETVLARLREAVVDRALHLPSAVLDRVRGGDLLSRVGDDVAKVAEAVTSALPQVASAGLTVLLTLVGLGALDWRLALAGAVALPLYVLALRWYLPRSAPRYAAERVAMGERAQALVSSLQGVDTVHAYADEDRHRAVVDERSGQALRITLGVFRLFTDFGWRMNRAEYVGLAAVLAVGFALVRSGDVTVGAVTTAALLFHRLFGPLGLLLFTFDDVQSAGASLVRMVGVADLDVPPAPVPATGRPVVELRGVGHAYDGPPVLADVDLVLAPGERVALVGASGAGKTTLAGVLAGALQPVAGEVLVDGAAVDLRAHVGLVSQEVHVFAGTLADDVRLARPGATDAEVAAALTTVGADWALALGLDALVGEGGQELTAPQAQQLALARLVLADPPVAVLDEATAEAGSAGARDLEEAALAATAGRTTLVVAHRLTQAARADRVVVLAAGRVVEQGTHAELVAAGGRYADLWSAWTARG